MAMKTLNEAVQRAGVSVKGEGLRVHFSPIPNWYGYFTGFDCPRCGESIDWAWEGELPPITTPQTVIESGIHPVMKNGAKLIDWQHRYIALKCAGCGTTLEADNFDQ